MQLKQSSNNAINNSNNNSHSNFWFKSAHLLSCYFPFYFVLNVDLSITTIYKKNSTFDFK